MSRARGVPGLDLMTGLACLGGVGLPVGMAVDADTWTVTESDDSPESMVFTTPRFSDAGMHVAEGQVARVWRGDDDFDEWDVSGLSFQRGADAIATVTCRPILYRLAECGLVTDPDVDPADGRPALEWGVVGLTTREVLQSKVFNHPDLAASLAWLVLGTIDPEDVLIDIDVSWASVREVIDACIAGLARKNEDCWIPPLERIGSGDDRYQLHILRTPDV